MITSSVADTTVKQSWFLSGSDTVQTEARSFYIRVSAKGVRPRVKSRIGQIKAWDCALAWSGLEAWKAEPDKHHLSQCLISQFCQQAALKRDEETLWSRCHQHLGQRVQEKKTGVEITDGLDWTWPPLHEAVLLRDEWSRAGRHQENSVQSGQWRLRFKAALCQI